MSVKRSTYLSACLGGLTLMVITAVGDTPQAINYQGNVKDNAGVPFQGNYSIKFELFDASSGGSGRWTETHASVPINEGLFTVRLGDSTAFPADLWTHEQVWLEISIAGKIFSPRERLVAVPYAIQAATAEALSRPLFVDKTAEQNYIPWETKDPTPQNLCYPNTCRVCFGEALYGNPPIAHYTPLPSGAPNSDWREVDVSNCVSPHARTVWLRVYLRAASGMSLFLRKRGSTTEYGPVLMHSATQPNPTPPASLYNVDTLFFHLTDAENGKKVFDYRLRAPGGQQAYEVLFEVIGYGE